MKPTVGRTVHFHTDEVKRQTVGMGAGPYAAIVTRVHDDWRLDLTVLAPADFRHVSQVAPRAEARAAVELHWWEWPPR